MWVYLDVCSSQFRFFPLILCFITSHILLFVVIFYFHYDWNCFSPFSFAALSVVVGGSLETILSNVFHSFFRFYVFHCHLFNYFFLSLWLGFFSFCQFFFIVSFSFITSRIRSLWLIILLVY